MTNFEAVSKFNELIGNAKGAADAEQVDKQSDLIRSEFNELEMGVHLLRQAAVLLAKAERPWQLEQAREMREAALTEIRDGIADVLVTTYGLAHRMGIDADADMRAVEVSNNSKFFVGDHGQAAQIVGAMSDSLGIEVEARRRGEAVAEVFEGPVEYVWAFVSADDSDPERPRGKLLKAPGYKPPVFD